MRQRIEGRKGISDEDVLKQNQIVQEIIITKNGEVQVPWITPKATGLIIALWEDLNDGRPFPVTVLSDKIYCG